MRLLKAVRSGAARGLTQIHPIGGAVAGSLKARAVDQSLQQQRSISIVPAPILRELSRRTRQDCGGQTLDGDRWQNQKAAVIDDVLQIASALGGVPANPAIPHRHLPGWAGP